MIITSPWPWRGKPIPWLKCVNWVTGEKCDSWKLSQSLEVVVSGCGIENPYRRGIKWEESKQPGPGWLGSKQEEEEWTLLHVSQFESCSHSNHKAEWTFNPYVQIKKGRFGELELAAMGSAADSKSYICSGSKQKHRRDRKVASGTCQGAMERLEQMQSNSGSQGYDKQWFRNRNARSWHLRNLLGKIQAF